MHKAGIPQEVYLSLDRQWAKSRTRICAERYVRAEPTHSGGVEALAFKWLREAYYAGRYNGQHGEGVSRCEEWLHAGPLKGLIADVAALRTQQPMGDALAISDAHSAGFEAGVLAFASPLPSGKEITAEEGQAWGVYLVALRTRTAVRRLPLGEGE